MRFLIDAQLPPALAGVFRAAGHEAVHVFEVDFLVADDRRIAAYAAEAGLVVVTKDEDFVLMRRFLPLAPKVIWVRLGNSTNKVLAAIFRPMIAEIVAAFEAGETVVEIR